MRDCLQAKTVDLNIPAQLEVIWVRMRPTFLPRSTASIIVLFILLLTTLTLIYCLIIYKTRYISSRPSIPNAGITIAGDVNHLDIEQLVSEKIIQVLDKPTRESAILDKIVTNVADHYQPPLISPQLHVVIIM